MIRRKNLLIAFYQRDEEFLENIHRKYNSILNPFSWKEKGAAIDEEKCFVASLSYREREFKDELKYEVEIIYKITTLLAYRKSNKIQW